MKRIATLVVVVIIVMMVPGSALAQSSSTCQAYNPELCSVSGESSSSVSAANSGSSSSSSGTLPFTGLDVALLAIGGGGLLGAGLVVRRLSRRLD
jgi:hypothetical protein